MYKLFCCWWFLLWYALYCWAWSCSRYCSRLWALLSFLFFSESHILYTMFCFFLAKFLQNLYGFGSWLALVLFYVAYVITWSYFSFIGYCSGIHIFFVILYNSLIVCFPHMVPFFCILVSYRNVTLVLLSTSCSFNLWTCYSSLYCSHPWLIQWFCHI